MQTNTFIKFNKTEVLESWKSGNKGPIKITDFLIVLTNIQLSNFLKVLNPYSQFLYLSCHEPIMNNSQDCRVYRTHFIAAVSSSAHLQAPYRCLAWAGNLIREWKEVDFFILTSSSPWEGLQTITISVWHWDLSPIVSWCYSCIYKYQGICSQGSAGCGFMWSL